MSYRLKPGRPLSREVKRVVDKQFSLALGELHAVGTRQSDDAIHEARRHLKKVRALLRMCKRPLGGNFSGANERLRRASRLLAPIADGEAVVDTMIRIAQRYPNELRRSVVADVRRALLLRERRVDRRAAQDRVLEAVKAELRVERKRIRSWRFETAGFRSLAPGLKRTAKRARRAMARAIAEPTTANFHEWRRRVKDTWLQARLINGRCGGGLGADLRRLEALDGFLGEAHNCVLLEEILTANPLTSTKASARCLLLIQRYEDVLRRNAVRVGSVQFAERPHDLLRRIRSLWHDAKRRAAAPKNGKKPCRAAA